MHELGLAMEIAAIAGEEAAKAGARRVETVHLRLGARAGVVKEALLFAWEAATADSPSAGARLAIEDAAGREFEVVALEVEDPPA
jgi:hydrogenase nickel incorporation protein HypA/HybF